MSFETRIEAAERQSVEQDIRDRLETGIAAKLLPVYADIHQEILAFAQSSQASASAREHVELLAGYCAAQSAEIGRISEAEQGFQTRIANAFETAERNSAIIDLARELDTDRKQLQRDRKALKTFFDADAVTERLHKRRGERERALAHALDRLGAVCADAVAEDPLIIQSAVFIELTEGLLAEMRDWKGDARIRCAAHRCLRRVAQRIEHWPFGFWFETVLSATRRAAMDEGEDVWVQCEAFDTLLALSPKSMALAISSRLEIDMAQKKPQVRDSELFVRRHLVRLVCANYRLDPAFADILKTLTWDQSGAVRQAFADSLHLLPRTVAGQIFSKLRADRDAQVRAALFADAPRFALVLAPSGYAKHIAQVLRRDKDEFVLRMTLDAAAGLAAYVRKVEARGLDTVIADLRDAIVHFQQREVSPKLLRWADEAFERVWLASDIDAIEIATVIRGATQDQPEADIRPITRLRHWLAKDSDRVGRVMAVLAQRDFGLSVKPGVIPRIQRGEWIKRRFWRFLFEGGNSATDKRQAFKHTTGRHYFGTLIAPSARMAELAPTKVPGEPLFESSEGGWRNYLPLVDQVLAALDHGRPIRLFTSGGITELTPPSSLLTRLRMFWKVTRTFAALAEQRNRDPAKYVATLRGFGFDIAFRGYQADKQPNPQITRFYSAGGALAGLIPFADQARTYASTVYANNLAELAIFLVLASLWFFGRHVALGWYARRLRSSLSIVLGGWGTRGKSGTERLKAGLMNALGPSIVSKTTGCEAMFLIGTPFGGLTEMFLFRPYDKATIWEQFNLLRVSVALKTRVFLWECMGLNPGYVRVLQRDWMRDDIATITNTYPDHEDVQGPAGRNIPEVMCEFIPEHSQLLTTEEEMLPILEQGASARNTSLRAVGWKQAGLIHKELLDRFPYEEHPYNIALVTAMGDELGLEPDYCVREMADRVVADLGVLKTYPRSAIKGRTLEFVMGMSANERFGAMGNWQRMGFAEHDIAVDPQVFISTVVNNRADRVPRSRVFARMLVRDVAADRHFLIGSNVEGLLGFIDEEWEAYSANLSLFGEETAPLDRLEELAKQQRIALDGESLDGLLAAMLAPQSGKLSAKDAAAAAREGQLEKVLEKAGVEHFKAICAHYGATQALSREYGELHAAVAAGGNQAALDARLRALLGKAFKAKLVPIRDVYTKGEAIVRLIADQTPPGLVNRIMGMQNIKGTGLDWVYRWQAWETVWKACQQMRSEDPAEIERGYRTLAGFQEFGILSEAEVYATIADLRARLNLVPGISSLQLDALKARVESQVGAQSAHEVSGAQSDEGKDQGSWLGENLDRIVHLAEGFIDPSDAVRRRRNADRIYKALIAEQISLQRAATELKELTSRQKGGWMSKAIKSKLRAA